MKGEGCTLRRIRARIRRSRRGVFLTSDFDDLAPSRRAVLRILGKLAAAGELARVSRGVYAKTRISSITGKRIIHRSLPDLAWDILDRLGIEACPSSALEALNAGRSTQVPTGRVIGVRKMTKRKIAWGGHEMIYELKKLEPAGRTRKKVASGK